MANGLIKPAQVTDYTYLRFNVTDNVEIGTLTDRPSQANLPHSFETFAEVTWAAPGSKTFQLEFWSVNGAVVTCRRARCRVVSVT
jgi:hypothetical protein